MAYVYWISTLYGLLQVYSDYVKPINGPELWKKTRNGITLAPDFKKQRDRPTKKRCREVGEYQEQGTKNTKLCRSGLVIKCNNCGREGHNKKSCYKQSQSVGPSAGPPPTTRPFAGPPSAAGSSIGTSSTAGPSTIVGPPPTTRPSKTPKTSKYRGRPKLPIRRSHK